jgi:steroid delta-isomerase-like uncharacterized protein
MSTESNKAVIRRIFSEVVTQGNLAAADELLSANYVNHDFPAPAAGGEGFKQVIAMFRSAFPDMAVVVEAELAEGDRVATRGVFTGTHQGDFMGIPATGKRISVKYIDIWRLEDGRGRENWVQMDMLGLMQQLGAAPA